MGSYYEINVALKGQHYFATAPRSIVTEDKAKTTMADMRKRYPESEGFSISCTHYQSVGHKTFF